MSDLDTLRPEVRSALGAMVRADVCRDSVPTEAFDLIRAELLRLTDENARLNKIESLATEQRLQMEDVELYLMDVSQPDDEDAPWCDRMKSAIELLVQDCNYAVGQKNKAEAELAALKSQTFRGRAQDAIDKFAGGEELSHEEMCEVVNQAVCTERELAALKARIASAPLESLPPKNACGRTWVALDGDAYGGKRVRLVVEE